MTMLNFLGAYLTIVSTVDTHLLFLGDISMEQAAAYGTNSWLFLRAVISSLIAISIR